MKSRQCRNRCSKERKKAYYWQGYKRCTFCEVFINTKLNRCHCCRSLLKVVACNPSKHIRLIRLSESYIKLENSNKVITKQTIREDLEDVVFYRRINIIPESLNNSINIDTELLFLLLNYFAGMKYRLARPIGHGNEQISLIKMNQGVIRNES